MNKTSSSSNFVQTLMVAARRRPCLALLGLIGPLFIVSLVSAILTPTHSMSTADEASFAAPQLARHAPGGVAGVRGRRANFKMAAVEDAEMADAAPALPPPPSPMRMSAASFTRQDGRAVETENHNTNDGETNSADGLAPGERMLIKTAQLRVALAKEEMDKAAIAVESYIKSVGGYLSDAQASRSGTDDDAYVEKTFTFRVPERLFDDTVNGLPGVVGTGASVLMRNVQQRDVTDEFVDHSARKKTLEATHAQLVVLMGKTSKVDEILSVRRELTSVTQQMEAHKARLLHLSRSATLATVRLTLVPQSARVPPPVDHFFNWNPMRTLAQAMRTLLVAVAHTLDALIWMGVVAVPVSLVVLALRPLLRCLPSLASTSASVNA